MKFRIHNLNRLKSDVEVMDEDDRIEIIFYDEDKPTGQNKFSITFRVAKHFIKLHEGIRQVKE